MSVATQIDVSRMDLVEPRQLRRADPVRMVRRAPARPRPSPGTTSPRRTTASGRSPATTTSSTVHMDWETYSSEKGAVALEELDEEQLRIRKSMLETDPPRHRELRNICNKRFSARGVGAYEDFIRDVARRVLDRALEQEEFDFVTGDLAGAPDPVPVRDLHRAAGGRADADPLGRRDDREPGSGVHARGRRPGRHRGVPEPPVPLPDRARRCSSTPHRQRDLRLEEPQDDAITALTVAQRGGRPVRARVRQLLRRCCMIAGNETTRHTISHGHARAHGEPRPDAAAKDDPLADRRPRVEEILRWATPVLHFRRTATRDTELRGQTIREGDKVVTWYISANRDEEQFADPYRFDVTRERRTSTSRSVRAARISASARTSPSSRRRSCSRSCSPASAHRAHWPGRADALELRERHQAHAGPRRARVAGSG